LDFSTMRSSAVFQPSWKMYSRALSKKDSRLIVKKRDYFLSMNESLGSEQP
jgi:hypothetical protein